MFKAYPRHPIRFGTKLAIAGIKELFSSDNKDVVANFENRFAEYIGTKFAVLVPAARFGLYAGLKLYRGKGVSEGEVIMPAYTFKGMAIAVKAAGFNPVFVDVKDTGCNINEDMIERMITPKTKAVIVSHMFGIPCNMDKIIAVANKYNLDLIEDCAHACGASYRSKKTGTFGKFAVFSFGMGKNIVCLGGGALTTNDKDLYDTLKSEVARLPEQNKKGLFKDIVKTYLSSLLTNRPLFPLVTFPALAIAGMHDINYIDHLCNEETTVTSFSRALSTYSKFNHVQATLGLIQLAELESANNAFRRNAARYDTLIKDHVRSSPDLPDHALRTPYYYMIRVKNRDAFRKKMLKKGIDTKSDDMGNCSQIEGLNQQGMMFPNTEKLCNEITEISNSTDLTEKDSNRIGSMVGSSLA